MREPEQFNKNEYEYRSEVIDISMNMIETVFIVSRFTLRDQYAYVWVIKIERQKKKQTEKLNRNINFPVRFYEQNRSDSA